MTRGARRAARVVALALSLAFSTAVLCGCSGAAIPAGGSSVAGSGGSLENDAMPGVPIECLPAPQSPAPDPAAAATESNAMDADTFWGLIEGLDGSTDEDRIERLTEQLAVLPLTDLVAFDARLTLALYALDSGCRAEWYRMNEPEQLGFVSDDVFLYARADTVAAGRENWQNAVDEQTLPWGTADPTTGGGELLLYVATDAAARAGFDPAEFAALSSKRITVSYETGSNPAGWR